MRKHLLATLLLATPIPAFAQKPSVGAITHSELGKPGGPAAVDTDGTVGSQRIHPTGLPATRMQADRGRDRISIRDFVPAPACDGVTDDSSAVSAAVLAMSGTGRAIAVPDDCRILMGPAARLAGHAPILDGTGFVGEGGRDSGYPYGQRGGTILLTDTGGPAFIVGRNWRFEGLIFYWPGQTEAAAVANGGVPITMPPLISGAGTAGRTAAEVSSGTFSGNDVLNATRVLDFATDPSGGLHIERNRAFFLDAFLRLGVMPLESWVNDNDFTANAFQSAPGMLAAGPTHTLINWAGAHAADVQIVGAGTPTADSTTSVDGLQFHHNTTFGLGFGLRVMGGTLNLSTIDGNTFDGVSTALSVEAGGRVVGGTALTGGRVYSYTFGVGGNPATTPVVSVSASSAPGSSLSVEGVDVPSMTASLVDWEGASGTLDVINNKVGSGAPGGAAMVKFSSAGPTARLRVAVNRFNGKDGTAGYGVEVDQPIQLLSVIGNEFISTLAPIYLGGTFCTPSRVSANTSLGTAGTASIAGPMVNCIDDFENSWDVASSGWGHTERGSDGALAFQFQGQTRLAITPNGAVQVPGSVAVTGAISGASAALTGAATVGDLNVGGTGSVIAPWSFANLSFVTANGNPFGSYTAAVRYRKLGTAVTYDLMMYVTALGAGGGGYGTLSGLPFGQDGSSYCILPGQDVAVTSKGLTMRITPGGTTALLGFNDATTFAGGMVIAASGTCQTAN